MLTAKSAVITGSTSGIGLAIARALAEEGITCNAICPGYALLAAQPAKQFVRPEQVGALVVCLAGAAVASITGSALIMDGGWTAQ